MSRLRPLAQRRSADALIVAAALAAALEVALRQGAEQAPETTPWFTVPAIALVVLPLLARRRHPFGAPAAVWLWGASLAFVDGRLIPSTAVAMAAGLTAAFLLGSLADAREARVGLAVVLGGAVVIVFHNPASTPGSYVFTPILFAIAWLAGFALQQRTARADAAEVRAAHAEREREAAARVAVAEERARIARELHDIVAHAVSVMVLQVGAVRHRLPETRPDDREALEGVERAGRAALAEMRRLLGAMRQAGQDLELSPQPGLDGLDSLLEEVGRAGLPVRLHVEGDRVPLPRAVDLSAYRIVQEGLTNALKHAEASGADVTVRYGADDVRIEVRDDGRGAAPATDGLGHGLVGIRERVKIYGGEMSAGGGDGGFVLRTRLPLRGERP